MFSKRWKEAVEIVSLAGKEVYRNQDSPSWSPYNRGEIIITVWAVEKASGVIDNGGFEYFFANDWPDKPPYSLFADAFRRIGATEAADCIEDAVNMFPSKTPHLDYEMRREHMTFLRRKEGRKDSIIDNLGDRVIDLGEDTLTRLATYIIEHKDFFPAVKKHIKQRLDNEDREARDKP